jgi:hypothetical protein
VTDSSTGGQTGVTPAPDPVAKPALLENARLWPVVDPSLPPVTVKRLRKALKRGAFNAGGIGPGASDPRPPAPFKYRYLATAIGLPAVTALLWLGLFSVHGAWRVAFEVPTVILAFFEAIFGVAAIGAVGTRLSRRGRAVRGRGGYLLPRHFEPPEYALVERAALAIEAVTASVTGPLVADGADAWTRHIWNLARRARRVGELTKALGASSLDADELVADAIAPAAAVVSGAQAALTADVEALEQLSAAVANADAARGVLARLAEVRQRTDRVAELIATAQWDQPILDDEVLRARMTAAQQALDERVAEANAQAAALGVGRDES